MLGHGNQGIRMAMNKQVEISMLKECQFQKTDAALVEFFGNRRKPRHFYSPGRVNLIGEHIDYCGGHVLPAAIDLGIYFSVAPNSTNRIRIYSFFNNQDGKLDLNEAIVPTKTGDWLEYIKGVICSYSPELEMSGLDITLDSTIPGGGLSSSAALEVGLAYILEAYFKPDSTFSLDERKSIAWRTQSVENHFVGVNCGIMDQASIALGVRGCAIDMDCSTLDVKSIPANLSPYKLVIVNTNKDRKLSDSKYNERRAEVKTAQAIIEKVFLIDNLCDINEIEKCKALELVTDETLHNRARHVIEENIRVSQAAESLKFGAVKEFGRLLNESHQSLRDLYQVSCAELDFIVEQSQKFYGVPGARMTGAGFGGCALALVHHLSIDEYQEVVGAAYRKKFGIEADFYPVQIVAGTHEVLEELS